MANKNLNAAKEAKKDEFYTQLAEIENELKHYQHRCSKVSVTSFHESIAICKNKLI